MNASYLKRHVAAALLHTTEADVYRLAREGKLQWAEWSGGELYVTTESVKALLEEQQLSGFRSSGFRAVGRARAVPTTDHPSRRSAPTRARPETLAELRARGVVLAGDEAVAQAAAPVPAARDAVTDAQRAAIARLVAVSALKPAGALGR